MLHPEPEVPCNTSPGFCMYKLLCGRDKRDKKGLLLASFSEIDYESQAVVKRTMSPAIMIHHCDCWVECNRSSKTMMELPSLYTILASFTDGLPRLKFDSLGKSAAFGGTFFPEGAFSALSLPLPDLPAAGFAFALGADLPSLLPMGANDTETRWRNSSCHTEGDVINKQCVALMSNA